MNQNDKNSESSKRIKSLNQIYIPLKNKDSFPSLNGRRRNSHNYNFSIHEPLSPLTTHSSFIVPGSNGKHAGDASSDIKSKLSKETLTVNKEDPPRMPSPLRINTEKGYFLKEDNNSAHHNHNKRSNSLNSNSNSIKNDISGIFSGGGFANVKIPVQRYSSIDSLNNILEDSNSEVNTPIYPQPLRRGGERDTTLTHAYHSNPNLSNNKTQIPRNGLSSQQLQQLQQQKQQLATSQASSHSEFDFQKNGDFVDENERLMQQVVEAPFANAASPPAPMPLSVKKQKKLKDKEKKRLWTRNKSRQGDNPKVGGPRRMVFGLTLAEAIAASKIKANYELPAVVYRCIEYLDKNNAQNEEGIYRLSGSAATIQALKDRFNNEGDFNLVDSEEMYDIHAVAGLLKLFLRELTEPILTFELQPKFLQIPELESRNQKIYELANLVSLLPLENYTLLRCLSAHLVRIVQNSSVNKMTLHNITIVFSPTLNIPAGVFMLLLSEFQIIFCWTNQQQLQQQLIPEMHVQQQQRLQQPAAQQSPQPSQQQLQPPQQAQQMYTSPKMPTKSISANNISNMNAERPVMTNNKPSNLPHSKTVPGNLSNYNNNGSKSLAYSSGSKSPVRSPARSPAKSPALQIDALPPKPMNFQINKYQEHNNNRNSVSYMDGMPEHMKLNEMMAMKKNSKLEQNNEYENEVDILDLVDGSEEE